MTCGYCLQWKDVNVVPVVFCCRIYPFLQILDFLSRLVSISIVMDDGMGNSLYDLVMC